MKKFAIRRLVVIAGLSAASSGAMATCSSDYDSLASIYASSGLSSYLTMLASFQQSNPGCFSTTDPNTPTQVLVTSFTLMNANSQGLSNRLLGGSASLQTTSLGATGLAAGATPNAWNVWGNYSDDRNTYKVANMAVLGAVGSPFFFDAANTTSNLVLGADYGLTKSTVLGISAAFDKTAGRNIPGNPLTGATATANSASGQSLSLYVGSQLAKNWAIDATIGGGIGKSSPSTNTSADSTRRFVGANLSYANWIGNWQLNGKASYYFGNEEFQNAKNAGRLLPLSYYTAHLGQAKIGGEVGYWLADGVMPYVGVAYVNDVSRNRVRVTQLWDDDGVVFTAGINFFSIKNNLSGGVVYTDETNRKFVTHSNWMANINYRF
jgi:hypothetical protein